MKIVKNTAFQPELFGHDLRTRYLIGAAKHPPISARRLGRLLDIDCARLPEFYRWFNKIGVLRRNEDDLIELDESFFAFAELVTFLRAIGGQRVIVVPEDSPAPPPPAKRLLKLFGTRNRTMVLVALSQIGSANITDLAATAGINMRSAGNAVDHFVHHGILNKRPGVNEIVVEFADWKHRDLLLVLLARLTEAFPRMPGLAKVHAVRVRHRAAVCDRDGALSNGCCALPFGTELQAKVLLELARRGTLTTATLASGVGTSHSCVRTAALALEEYGLTVCESIGSGPARKRWIALNERHPLTPAIRRYAEARFDQPIPPSPLPPRSFRPSRRVTGNPLPGHALRNAVIREVYMHESTSAPEIARSIGSREHEPVRRWLEDLRVAGLIEYGPIGAHMIARPIKGTNYATNLSHLMQEVIRFTK